ncbi:transporter, partial [Pelomonas sp. HMWF004]
RQEATAGEPRIHGLGLALRLPLGTAGRNEPLMAAALSAVELAEAQLRELLQQLDTEQALARHAEANTRQQALDETARARLLRERAELIAKSFQAGETALPDMLRSVTAATQAEAAAARAHAARAQATSRLQQALGTLP